jgi:hypothetical protein
MKITTALLFAFLAFGCSTEDPGKTSGGKEDSLTGCGDGSLLVCEIFPADCPQGLVHEVVGGCFGECVDPDTCEPPQSNVLCDEALTNGFSMPSKAYQISLEVLDFDDLTLRPEIAEAAVLEVASGVGCAADDVAAESVSCQDLDEDASWSTACFVQTPAGFFFVTADFFDFATVTFNVMD